MANNDVKRWRTIFTVSLITLFLVAGFLLLMAFAINDLTLTIGTWIITLLILPALFVYVAFKKKAISVDSGILLVALVIMAIVLLWLIGIYWHQCLPKKECDYYKLTIDLIQAMSPFIVAFTIAVQIWTIKRGGEARPA
ncbi:MAG: hypothetical protein QW680_09525 [Pyrobaculum sp.]